MKTNKYFCPQLYLKFALAVAIVFPGVSTLAVTTQKKKTSSSSQASSQPQKSRKSSAKSAEGKLSQMTSSTKPTEKKTSEKRTAERRGGIEQVASSGHQSLSQALSHVRAGNYQQAVPLLFSLSRRSDLQSERAQIKYILGNALLDLKLYQVAAFMFVDVIRSGNAKYAKPSVEKLSLAADALGDDTLLNYALSRIQPDQVPDAGKDLITYRLAEIKMRNGHFEQAAQLLTKVPIESRYFFQAKYKRGLAYLEAGHTAEAIKVFQNLLAVRSGAGVTDTNRVIAQMALARALYQAQDWDGAIAAYREIPRDHDLWHEALFESSWAMLRGARFRSALSNFHSLHSTYYEDYYIPESLLLRSIVYLYICKYDEMEKVLNLFEKIYAPLSSQIAHFINHAADPLSYYQEVESAYNYSIGKDISVKTKLPLKVSLFVIREGDVKRAFGYMRNLNEEKNRIESMPALMRSSFGPFAKKILSNRFKNAKISIGEMAKAHLQSMRNELRDLYEQAGFIRYEMINGRKEQLKKVIAGKDIPKTTVDEQLDKTFYVQNGYEYWPFDGEYWLDEIGNYHYLGKQSCE